MDLPGALKNLHPLIEEWSIADAGRRVDKIGSAPSSVLRSLTENVLPRIEQIDAYLDSFGNLPFDETALGLLGLAESALDAQTELEARGTPKDMPE